jgi:hypothetical protein
MILLFPNHDTLQLALTSSIVSTEVTLKPAAVTFDNQGKIYLETSAPLSRTTIKNLDKIGVKGSRRHATDVPEHVICWPQIVHLIKVPGTPNVSNQAPVLFELSDSDDLPTLVAEMLRLGNDRQGFRWFAEPNEEEPNRVLLRVIGPPFYTLLRALDKSTAGTKGTVRAYVERTPHVWIELGYTHPLAEQIRVAEEQLLLLRSPRDWVFLEEAPFQDVYDIMQFKLPATPAGWKEADEIEKISVPVRLTAGNAADVPELWVIRENAIEQLDTLVRDSDDKLTQRLKFAVANDTGGIRTVVLRTIPSKLPPPVLPLENVLGFKPFWKLPNLFIPVGRRLHPTLRRDAVRKLLADDPDQVVWLYPGESGSFTPESVPDGAFRSLEDWVSYVIEMEQEPLAAWIESTRFDFDQFICKDGPPKTKPDKGDREKIRDDADEVQRQKGLAPAPKGPAKGKPAPAAKNGVPADFLPAPEIAPKPSEWIKKRAVLEEQFKSIDGALDDPERRRLWPELAVANAGAGDSKTEAAICWLNAMWGADPIPDEWVSGWLRSEVPSMGNAIKVDEFKKYLAQETPSHEEARITIASFLWLASQRPMPAWLNSSLPAMQSYLERHEGALPIKAVWLTGYRLSQLAGADVLGLARIRDRLLQRLLNQGLSAERDLPLFLRVAGHEDSERLRMVNEQAMALHTAVRKWTEHIPVNLPYVDLLFSYALAKLGESTKARKLIEDARKVMETPIPASWDDYKQHDIVVSAISSNFLYKAFKFRIEEALANKSDTAQLPANLLDELKEIDKKIPTEREKTNNPYWRAKYVIGRMRHESRILEPSEKLDPYADARFGSAFDKAVNELHAIQNPATLADTIRDLSTTKKRLKFKEDQERKTTPQDRIITLEGMQFLLYHEAILLSTRVGESFAAEMLQNVPVALAGVTSNDLPKYSDIPKEQGELLERALLVAGHFGRRDLIKKLVDEFTELIRKKPEDVRFKLINSGAGECLRSFKKYGMRDEIDNFLTKLKNEVLHEATLSELKKKYAKKEELWGLVLQTLQNLAASWLIIGLNDQAIPLLDEGLNELIQSRTTTLSPQGYTNLTRAYVRACGQFTTVNGIARITELFRRMDKSKITNTWTTAQYYSRFHINIIEDVVQARISDDCALSPSGRRWLSDDEFLVRRRIHADMKREREKNGL